jgi:hypothetical protein
MMREEVSAKVFKIFFFHLFEGLYFFQKFPMAAIERGKFLAKKYIARIYGRKKF